MPTTDAKPKQFALTLSEDDMVMLKDVAAHEHDSAAETVRALVRSAYAKRFKCKIPGATIMPTLRALIDQIAKPVPHYTGGNIAELAGLPVPLVTGLLEHVEKKTGVVECIDHMAALKSQRNPPRGQNWTWYLKVSREKALAAIEKAGIDLDADLSEGGKVRA